MAKEIYSLTEQAFLWLPDNPSRKVVGTITLSAVGGIQASIVGLLKPVQSSSDLLERFVVWGKTVGGKDITLLGSYQTQTSLHFPGVPTSQLCASEAVVGGHYRTLQEVRVHSVSIDIDHLTAWAGLSGVSYSYDDQIHTLQLTAKSPNPVVLGNAGGITILLMPFIHFDPNADNLHITEYCQLQLNSDSCRSFEEFQPLIGSVQTFLTLAVGKACYVTRWSGETDEKMTEVEGKPVWKEIEIVRKLAPNRNAKVLPPESMLFACSSIQPAPQIVMTAFLEAETRLKPVFDLMLPTYFHPDLPPVERFLTLAHAIEAFHRATVKGQEYQTDAQYEAGVKTRLLSALPDDLASEFRQSLINKFKYLHQYSLRKRLKDLLTIVDKYVARYIGDKDSFIEMVVESRNALVHATSQRPQPASSKLWDVAQQLLLILEVAVLSELRLTDEQISQCVRSGKRGWLILDNNPEFKRPS